jgi:hypothetical protein
LVYYSRYSSNALNPYFFPASVRRRNQNLNANLGPNRWTFATENQSSVECNVTGETTFHVLGPVVPVEKDGQL